MRICMASSSMGQKVLSPEEGSAAGQRGSLYSRLGPPCATFAVSCFFSYPR